MVCGSIATTPFPAVCGPTTTTLLPSMIHPSSAAADLSDDVYAKVLAGHGSKAARRFLTRLVFGQVEDFQ
jgi:hypothetical protein